MKDALFYYYRITPLKIIKNKYNYYFEYNNNYYFLWKIDKPIEYVKECIILNKNIFDLRFGKIVYNSNLEAISLINDNYYILTMIDDNRNSFDNFILNPYYINSEILKFKYLDHSNWGELWCNKIDYFEYQKKFIKVKYPSLYKSLEYFIGLSEIAISYFNDVNLYLKKEDNDSLTVCRRRIDNNKDSFFNPLNVVIDHKSRNLALYLQYLFINGDYSYEYIDSIIDEVDYSAYQYSLLMARILYPSFYFDLYEQIVNGVIKEEKIIEILKKSLDYEIFLKKVYKIISKKKSILKIDWLENIN